MKLLFSLITLFVLSLPVQACERGFFFLPGYSAVRIVPRVSFELEEEIIQPEAFLAPSLFSVPSYGFRSFESVRPFYGFGGFRSFYGFGGFREFERERLFRFREFERERLLGFRGGFREFGGRERADLRIRTPGFSLNLRESAGGRERRGLFRGEREGLFRGFRFR
jgi:hypothetical protein